MAPSKRVNNPQNSANMSRSNNSDLARLRAEIKRKQRNVNAKINRIENRHGINLRATSYAPSIVDAKKFGRYTASQLIAYGKKLDAFTDRRNQFVALADGHVVTSAEWNKYKNAERSYNDFGKKVMANISDIQLPGVNTKGKNTGQTIGEREAMTRKDFRSAMGDSAQKSYINVDRKPEHIASRAALDKLTKDMQNKASKKYLPKRVKDARKQANQMLDIMGTKDLKNKINRLSDYQFHILWEHTNFANALGGQYAALHLSTAQSESRWYKKVIEDNSLDIEEFAEWARKLPQNPRRKGRAQRSSRPNGRL